MHNTTCTQPRAPIIPGSSQHATLVTGSKVATILGISPYKTTVELWHQMRGEAEPEEATTAMLRGTIQESSILAWFFQVLRPDIEQASGETTVTRPDLPWAAANPDAVGNEDGNTIFVEAKSIARAKNSDGIHTEADEWGEPGTDEIPLYYYVQVLWQMHMTHGPEGESVNRTYVVKHGPWVDQYDVYPIDYNPQMGHTLETKTKAFFDSLTLPQCPYPIEDRAGIHKFFAKLNPDIEPDYEWEVSQCDAVDYLTAKTDRADAQAREDGAKARILKAMGTARTATCNGHTIGYRRATKKGVSLYPAQNLPTINQITTK
ncbi:hypothetical protein HMPREF2526_08420 [Corynebacterium sp. HMSC070E08]|uniref:lambda-exonuclease family protein n=1 Tax=Corynebacterium sp. HMSC070E08 TaxID=1715006 RepID=UPI0008A2A450|nr:YqaJ viral recombinase family protein [Corynebacterium sp. HMSC070E08]OFN78467.1 hypothetical protein HMPREF2526_08420 [Corynebacterium sp. HMSC070E08]